MQRNLSTDLMANAKFRLNRYNKENQTVSCIVQNDLICKVNLIVIQQEGAENCTVPIVDNTNDEVQTHSRKTTTSKQDNSLNCKLNKDEFQEAARARPASFRPVVRLVSLRGLYN